MPDLFKIEEEFVIEAANLEKVIDKLQEEFSYNCLLNVYIISQHGLIYLGVLKLEDDRYPEWIEPTSDDIEEGE